MASTSAAFLCSLLALLLWAPAGFLIACRLPIGRDLRLAAAPVLGWAVQNVSMLHVAMLGGFTPLNVLATTAAIWLAALLAPGSRPGEAPSPSPPSPSPPSPSPPSPSLPMWVFAAAALIAAGVAAAVLPKISTAGVALADPIYDHAKIALVDEIVRTGVPPANPFIGAGDGSSGSTAYYYYWLFGAAQLALITGASGWAADAAATWFTAFASLSLMCGLAFHLSRARAASAVFVLLAACGGSLRPVLTALFGQDRSDEALEHGSGLAGWFFQTSWSPHHVAAAAAVVLTLLLMERMARAPSAASTLVVGLLVAASFGSSLWVGGITFALCAGAAGIVLMASAKPGRRLPIMAGLSMAGGIAIALIVPLVMAQFRAAMERGGGAPVLILPFPVLGPAIPDGLRGWLDLPAYWLILLPIEFPAAWLLGAIAALRLKSALTPVLSAAACASLFGGWLLVSTAGENNDLGWRAVLPGVIILTAFAGAWFAHGLARRRVIGTIASVALVALALPDGLDLLHKNIVGRLSVDGARFADAPAVWDAARRHTAAGERLASNPRPAGDLTPWPINMSWALLANRRSCFAGDELALAFSSLSPLARAMATDLFDRVFAGTANAADLESVVRDFGCKVIVLTPQDGAWSRDPFEAGSLFTRVEEVAGKWRIYRAAATERSASWGQERIRHN